MARQEVDIGVEGNDGTGDSIRESFRKVNENFREIYAVVGKGGQIGFTSLSDTPDSLSQYEGGGVKAFIPIVKQDATGIDIWELASDSSDPNTPDAADSVEFIVREEGKIIVKVGNIKIINDSSPALGGPLNASGLGIANIGTEEADVTTFNRIHGTSISVDDLVIDKKFADKNYIPRQDPGETINVPAEPVDGSAYTKTFAVLVGQNKANITAHGLTRGSDGAAYVFNTPGAGIDWQRVVFVDGQYITQSSLDIDEDGNLLYSHLQDGDTIYIGILDQNNIGFWLNQDEPLLNDSEERERLRLKLSPRDSAQLSITDAGYDTSLEGFFLSHQVMPRASVVRRQGDTMEGPLILHDHPGDLAGAGTPAGKDDLQAVTKLYVDAQSNESSANIFVSTVGDDAQTVAPPGKEGSSLAYAYRTVNAAARKAEAIMKASPYEPGPYMQDIVASRTISGVKRIEKSRVNSAGIVGATGSNPNTKTIVEANLDFIAAETIAWVQNNIETEQTTTQANITVDWTGRVIDYKILEDDLRKAVSASILDYLSGNTVNFLSNRAGIEYYNDEYGKSQAGLVKEVLASAIERAKTLVGSVIVQSTVTPTYQSIYEQQFITFVSDTPDSVDQTFVAGPNGTLALQRNIIMNGVFSAEDVPSTGLRYTMYFTNTVNGISENGYVDQGNPQNQDLRVGKVIRGKTSGALGRIISYYPGADTENNPNSVDDVTELELLLPKDFIKGENLEFGNLVNTRNITIHVETGTYYEDYPIRLPANTSLVGNEMRRTHIRPKNTVSQSPWADIYFYRDKEFDGLTGDPTTSSTGYADNNLPVDGEPYINPLTVENGDFSTGRIDGYFGRHYLVKPSYPKNVDRFGQLAFTNPGGYINAASLIEKNKEFLQEETLAFIEYRIQRDIANTNDDEGYANVFNPAFETNVEARDRYKNFVAKIVDAMTADLRTGGNFNILAEQSELYFSLLDYPDEKEIYAGVLINLKQMMDDMVQNIVWVDNLVAPYRESDHPDQYINTNLVVEAGITGDSGILDNQITLIDFAIEPNTILDETRYNCAKRSTEVDVFLMNDATIVRQMSVTGHGGFMVVLDPEGQILTKSPYIQTGSSFSQSINRQAFRGGMLVDAFCANTPLKVTSVESAYRINVEAPKDSGLYVRKPQTPAPFYIDGVRYQVNDIVAYDRGGINGPATATLVLDTSSGPADPLDLTKNLGFTIDPTAYLDGYPITLQTAGNRSQLGNDFTQVNDLGYGLVCINGGISEMVSMFTYYCYTSYYAGNGGQIRSVTGSSCNGVYGLVATGSDPNEVPDDVVLVNDMVQGAVTFSTELIITLDTNVTISAADVTNGVAITGSVSSAGGTTSVPVYQTVSNKIYVKDVTGSYQVGEEISIDGVATGANIVSVDTSGYENLDTKLSMYFYEVENIPTSKGELEYYHDDPRVDALGNPLPALDRIARYELASVEIVNGLTVDGYTIDTEELGTSGSPTAFGYFVLSTDTRTVDETDPVTAQSWATITITKTQQNGGQYKVNVDRTNNGEHYKVGDQFIIKGGKLGGTDGTNIITDPQNDVVIEVTSINQSAINVENGVNTGSIRTVEVVSGVINIIPGFTPLRDGQVYKANFSTSNDNFDNDGLLYDIPEGKPLIIRANNTHQFGEIESAADLTIRPSTAVNFSEDYDYTYRSISFGSNDSVGNPLGIRDSLTGFDSSYDWVRLNVASDRINTPVGYFDPTQISLPIGGTTTGATIGDTSVAINRLSEVRDIWRINNNFLTNINYRPNSITDGTRTYEFSGELPKVVVWGGKKHYVYNYREFTTNTVSISASNILAGSLVQITDLGTSTDWNAIAGTTGVTYNVGDTFTAAANGNGNGAVDWTKFDDQRLVYSENNLFALVDLVEISEVELEFGTLASDPTELALAIFPRIVDYAGGISEARIRQAGNTGAWGVVKIAASLENNVKLYQWSGVDFNTTGALEVWLGDPADPDPATGSWTPLEDQDGDPIVPILQNERVANITGQASGIVAPISQGFSGTITLRAGLQDGSPATITIDISTCRATGHDFLDIGTGGYNQSNYPNVILGYPASVPVQENEVIERNKGRVFYVSTDQDGFFRVGRFFTVDQGTGTVTFAASIALSDVDGIGFKRGVVVTEFSTDSAMSDNADDTVPVESAVRGYVNRRLGYDQAGNAVPNPLGPSVLTQNGAVPMLGNLKMNGYTIVNIAPVDIETTAGTTAVNRDYVDLQTQEYAQVAELRDVELKSASTNEFLGTTNTKTVYISAKPNDIGAGATFDIGKYLTDSGGVANYGKIIGKVAKTDISLGTILVISYEAGPDSYDTVNPGENATAIYDGDATLDGNGNVTGIVTGNTRNSVVLAGPWHEVINISEEPHLNYTPVPVSDIAISTRRLENDPDTDDNYVGDWDPTVTYANGSIVSYAKAFFRCVTAGHLDVTPPTDDSTNWVPHVFTKREQPTAYYNLQINPNVIIDADVNSAADILQSKLYMQEADNFVLNQLHIPTEAVFDATTGYEYQIVSIGDTTPAQWNTIAGTTGVTYVAGDTFTASGTGIGPGTTGTIKRYINAGANVTLPKANTVTRQDNQATLGLSAFDIDNFKVTRGYVQLKENGIPLTKLRQIASDTVLGNSTATAGNVTAVTFSDVVDQGNGLQLGNFNFRKTDNTLASPADYASAGALTRTGTDAFEVLPITVTGGTNSLVKTDNSGNIVVASQLEITQGKPVLINETGATGRGLVVQNVAGGVVLTSASTGTNNFGPTVKIPGALNLGRMSEISTSVTTDNATVGATYRIYELGDTNWNTFVGTTGITYALGDIVTCAATTGTTGRVMPIDTFNKSTLQNSSSSMSSKAPYLATDWTYTNFIEAPYEKATGTTGIAIGSGSGVAGIGEIALVVNNVGNNQRAIPFTFSIDGTIPDTDSSYQIGSLSKSYSKLYADEITTDGSIVLGHGSSITDNAGEVDSIYTVNTTGDTNWTTKVGETITNADDAVTSGDDINRTLGKIVRVQSTGGNGSGTLRTHPIILDKDTGDGYFSRDVITGNKVYTKGIVNRNTDGVGDIGASNKKFATVYATTFEGTATQAQYADLAENYLGDADYEPGTVLVFGGDAEVTLTDTKGDTRVAGVVTTNPAHLMNSALEGDHVVGIALQGRVPCKVIGKVRKGDMLVTSAIPRYAIVNNAPGIGQVIGKAVANKDDEGRGEVEVVVGRV